MRLRWSSAEAEAEAKELLAASGMYRYAHYMAACLHRNGRLNRHHMNGKEKDPAKETKNERTHACVCMHEFVYVCLYVRG